jgi:hypothetical protein
MKKPITRKEFQLVQRQVKDALKLASTHDPDHAIEIRRALRWCERLFGRVIKLEDRVDVTERQLQRVGAPQYRKVRNGIYAERVRKPRGGQT